MIYPIYLLIVVLATLYKFELHQLYKETLVGWSLAGAVPGVAGVGVKCNRSGLVTPRMVLGRDEPPHYIAM